MKVPVLAVQRSLFFFLGRLISIILHPSWAFMLRPSVSQMNETLQQYSTRPNPVQYWPHKRELNQRLVRNFTGSRLSSRNRSGFPNRLTAVLSSMTAIRSSRLIGDVSKHISQDIRYPPPCMFILVLGSLSLSVASYVNTAATTAASPRILNSLNCYCFVTAA